jgi:hypothetical protein
MYKNLLKDFGIDVENDSPELVERKIRCIRRIHLGFMADTAILVVIIAFLLRLLWV